MLTIVTSLEGIDLGLIIYMCLPFQSHHADRVKKLHQDQGDLDSRTTVGFRNDVSDVERQKGKQGPLQ